jgi:hypothetical protein
MNNKNPLPLTILHVDDDEDQLSSVKSLISKVEGIEFVECTRPGQIIGKLGSKRLDVSIVDLEYAGKMRDREVVGILQDIAPNAKIIVLSNFGRGDAKANPYHAYDVIPKRVFHASPEVLLRALIGVIRDDGSNPPPSGPTEFEAVVTEFRIAVESWRKTRQINFSNLTKASLSWIISAPPTFAIFAFLVFSIIALVCACVLIPTCGLLFCVVVSCLAIGFQCAWQIFQEAQKLLLEQMMLGNVVKKTSQHSSPEI